MKLKLKNFRCYTDKTFDFDMETGMLLLSGVSGSGKTTILTAINFALFDKGTKLITFGKSSCSVEFQFNGWTIVRTKRPNRVVLTIDSTGETYEDDAAQGMIDDRYGKSFDVTSYVPQNNLKSFIAMSPTDKLAFLEKFAFEGVDLAQLKARCKALIKKHNEELISVTSRLEQATEHFQTLSKPEKILFPLKKTKNKDKSIKNERIRHKNCLVMINRCQSKLAKQTHKINELKVLLARKETLEENLEQVSDKLGEIRIELKTLPYDGDDKLKELESLLESVVAYRKLQYLVDKYEQDKRRLEEMKESEREEMSEKIATIEKTLWKEYNKTDTDEIITDYTNMVKDIEEIERLTENLENYTVDPDKLEKDKQDLQTYKKHLEKQKELLNKLELQKEVYECPNCETTLRFCDTGLEIYDTDLSDIGIDDITQLEKEIKTLTYKINRLEYSIPEWENNVKQSKKIEKQITTLRHKYEEELPSFDSANNDLEHMRHYKSSQVELERLVHKLKKQVKEETYSTSITSFSHSLGKQKTQIKNLQHKVDKKVQHQDEEELRKQIEIQRQNKLKKTRYEKEITILKKEQSHIMEQISEAVDKYNIVYGDNVNITLLEKELSKLHQELEKHKQDLEQHTQNLEKIAQYEKYTEELSRYNEWSEKVKKLTNDEIESRKKYAGATLLKDKILEAESLAIINIVNGINTHAQDYLEKFFPIDPIVIELQPFKQTKKSTRPQINLQIEYKGMEMDITMLSGGETARVVLAYTLALAEMFNSPLIMLDECTASIDQNLTSVVVEGIRENFPNKLVLVIAHQVVSGIFDKVWEMK